MTTLLTEPAAAAILVLGEKGRASLSEVARASGRSISTTQRALEGLIDANVVDREKPRGRFGLASDAPISALRELAEWRLGPARAEAIRGRVSPAPRERFQAPVTVRSSLIRAAWPEALRTIVSAVQPQKVILFGSQARGDAQPDSDVDLLVVFDHEVDRRAEQVRIGSLLRDAPFAKDVLVASPSTVAHPAAGTAVAEALKDGVVVYER